MMTHRYYLFLFYGSFFITTLSAHAATGLNYTNRFRHYSGFSTTARGDDESIGMAGATVAIPFSISSLESNPAGLTMTMGNVSAQINSNELKDRTSLHQRITNKQGGLAVVPGRWGYSFSYLSPITEQAGDYEIKLKQFHASVSRFFAKKWSLGASVVLNQVRYTAGMTHLQKEELSYKIGVIRHLGNHFLVGLSFSPAQTLAEGFSNFGSPELPGFAQPMEMPLVWNLGIGWIPNRFFRAGVSCLLVGESRNTGRLVNQNATVGETMTLQPRLGFSYTLSEFRLLKVAVQAGAYYESPRIAGVTSKLHGTVALQVNPWFINAGIGVDRAVDFNNVFVGVGVDVVRLMRVIKMIPQDPIPPYQGVLPHPFTVSANGLPPTLTVGEERDYAAPTASDVKSIIGDIFKSKETAPAQK